MKPVEEELSEIDRVLFSQMEGNYISEEEHVFFEQMKYKEQYDNETEQDIIIYPRADNDKNSYKNIGKSRDFPMSYSDLNIAAKYSQYYFTSSKSTSVTSSPPPLPGSPPPGLAPPGLPGLSPVGLPCAAYI